MRRYLAILILIALLCAVPAAFAQPFTAILFETTQQLDSICNASGHPLADGTVIEVWQDRNPAGIGPEDSLAIQCNHPAEGCYDGPIGSLNMNTFTVNGVGMGLDPGMFYTDLPLSSALDMPNPNRFYLRICLPSRYLVSNVFSPTSGPSEIELGPWQCIEQACAGCLPPPAPTNFQATDNSLCGGVRLTWEYADNVDQVDAFLVYRSVDQQSQLIATLAPTLRLYMDSTAASGVLYTYSIQARRNCNGTFAYSSQPSNDGTAAQSPPIPALVTATQNACSLVTVTWTYSTSLGIDSFMVRREGTVVGAILATGAPGLRTFAHHTTDITPAAYTVVGWNVSCGFGQASAPATGQANYHPTQVQGVGATDGSCDSTIITWTDVATETAYQVWRSLNDGSGPTNLTPSGLAANTVRYRDITGTTGIIYRYWVVATNSCGAAAASVYDTGSRLATPGQALGFAASDSTLCDRVHLAWTNATNNQGYKILRALGGVTDTLGTVGQDVTQYDDVTATPGVVYTYSVRAFNGCGNGPVSGSDAGSRRNVPGQVTGVAASDTACTGVNITWNNVANEDSFRVYRDATHIGTTLANILAFTDGTANPGTTYNYTVVAVNACGAAQASAADQGTRRESLGQVTGVSATTNLCTGVNVTWQALAGADSFVVSRDNVRIGATGPLATSYLDNQINDGANHNYTVAGKNVCGVGSQSAPAQGRRLPTPPDVTGLAATNNHCAAVNVTWTNAAGADSFQVRRDGTRIGVTGSSGSSFTDGTAVPGTSYQYTVVAYNGCGAGNVPSAVTGLRTIPAVVTGLAATTNRCDLIRVTWQPVPGPVQIYRIYQNFTLVGMVDSAVHTFDVVPGGPGSWAYSVSEWSSECGESARSDSVIGTMQSQPTGVTNVQTTTNRCDGVLVSWTHGTGAIDGYIVRRGSTVIDSTNAAATSFLDANAPVGNSSYYVRPYSVYCNQPAYTGPVTGTRTPMPSAPANVAATTNECSRVHVTWNDLADETGYHVYRDMVLVGTLAANLTSYYDSTATPGNHSYMVAGINTCGEGARSAAVEGTFNIVPVAVTTLAASQDSCSSVTLTWQDVATAQYYRIARDGTVIDSVNSGLGQYHDINLTPGTYAYTMVSVNFCGNSAPSAPVDGVVQSIPTAVANLAATNNLCTINVTWSDLANEQHYDLWRDSTFLVTLPQNTPSYDDNTASVGVHHYAILAANQCGSGPLSAYVSGERRGAPTEASTLSGPDSTCSTAALSWTAVPLATGYLIYRDNVRIDSVGNITTYTASAATGDHVFAVQGSNACGNGPLSPTVTVNFNVLPASVTGLAASDNSCTSVVLTWNDVANEIGYTILRGGTDIGTVGMDVTTYTDNTATPGTTYSYEVHASNSCGNSQNNSTDNGIRLAPVGQVTGVTASSNLCSGINVAWTNLANETEYQVERDGTTIGTVVADTVHYLDVAASIGQPHTYRVRAHNTCGDGTWSAPATGTRLQSPGVPAFLNVRDSCAVVYVNWGSAQGDVDSYKIYRGTTLIATVPADTTDYIVIDAVAPGTYSYTVRSHSDDCGDSSPTPAQSGTSHAAPGVPTNLTAAPAMCDTVRLTWTASTGEVGRYYVRRDGTVIDSTTATIYRDTGLTNTADHSYTVAAWNSWCGQSAQTAAVTGHVLPLVSISQPIPQIVQCDTTLRVRLAHCGSADRVEFYLSLNSGAYFHVQDFQPVLDSVLVTMPDTTRQLWDNCRFRLVSIHNTRHDTTYSNIFSVDCRLAAGELDPSQIPTDFFLDQNYPNPFNPSTVIRFGVPRAAQMKVAVYDLLGREVAVVAEGMMQPGVHAITWDCRGCPSGMYLIRLQTSDRAMMRKMLLMK